MIDISLPAIFLSFDDHWEMEWVEYLSVLATFGVRATFYSCLRRLWTLPLIETAKLFSEMVKPEYWQALRKLAEAGHTVGYHTINHANMDVLTRQQGVEAAMRTEIFEGMKYFADAGFKPRHFCYPYGKHNAIIDDYLYRYFATLRTIVRPGQQDMMRFYMPTDLKTTRIFTAYDLKDPGCFDAVNTTLREKKVGFFFAHNPVEYTAELDRLFQAAGASGATFYPMSVLE